ncbi:alpha/beta hydrolase [Streptomyces sp. H10-C2]|uniref:alpha/beta fold hydrolase n=1 Tax=unclassified Streptomyces TaxID=2593676 RepID=UPI0024BA5F96|nr:MULTISPECIES: alpha/beta hydrolase [unclassified Streptomyces]MDJ0343763.1 alpha/beta hydrolase [Streptomyces sp. PH10-H1]MDJ0373284.1 alpha/beta hydrolase [Streptomyces sp. H10-C2]
MDHAFTNEETDADTGTGVTATEVTATEVTGAGAAAGPPPGRPPARRRSRLRRWTRRTALACAALLVAVTAASFAYNGFTDGRAAPPPGLSYVEAAGIHTRYQTWGTTGSPVVLVHGAFESAGTWSRLAPLLARNHRVYALDLTGSGYSERRGPYTVDHFTRQLLGFLDAMRLGGPGDRPLLVGHSSGAAMAAEAALRAPGRVGGVLLLDGDALDTGAGPPPAFRYVLVDPYRTSLLRLGLGSDWLIRKVYSSQCGPGCPPLDGAGLDEWRRPLQVPGAEGALWSMLGEGVPGMSADRLARLRGVDIPKAVVFGAGDDVFSRQTPAETAERIGAPAPVLIPGARHLSMISSPDAVATAVEALAGRTAR